jgi:hypothetical protein
MAAQEEHDRRTSQDLMDRVNSEIAAKRRTLRIVEGPRFREAYDNACTPCRNKAEDLAKINDQPGLERWIGEQLKVDHAEKNIRQLREVGRRLGVPNYNRLSKGVLLSEIARYEEIAGRKVAP